MSMLAPDATWIADGGGKVSAARRPVVGAKKVARALAGLARIGLPDLRIEMATANSAPAVLFYSGDRLDLVVAVEIVDDKISTFYAIRNPDKLAAVATARQISR
jgi:RNA polymerase sigma-70 factor (ECF subfamily)